MKSGAIYAATRVHIVVHRSVQFVSIGSLPGRTLSSGKVARCHYSWLNAASQREIGHACFTDNLEGGGLVGRLLATR
jgi:hypothetical protein